MQLKNTYDKHEHTHPVSSSSVASTRKDENDELAILAMAGPSLAIIKNAVTQLIILWLLGLISSYTLGGFIHVLLVIAVIIVLIRLIKGQKILLIIVKII